MFTTQLETVVFVANWVSSVNFPVKRRIPIIIINIPLIIPVECNGTLILPSFISKPLPRINRQNRVPFPSLLKNVEMRIKGKPKPKA
jgi:hypothetical protein